MRSVFAFCAVLLASTASWAQRPPIEVEDQRDLSRIVIPLGSSLRASVHQHRTQFDITLPGEGDIQAPDTLPRNVLSIVGGHGSVHLTIVPGARFTSWHEGGNLIVRVFDPAKRGTDGTLAVASRPNSGKPPTPPENQRPAARPVVSEPAAAKPPNDVPSERAQTPAAQTPAQTPAAQTLPAPQLATAETSAPPATEAAHPPKPIVRAFAVDAGADVGVAAFRRGQNGIVVFDDVVTLAEAEPGEPATLTPTVQAIQRGTLASLPLAPDETLAVTRSDGTLTVSIAAPTGSPAVTSAVPTGIQFQITRPGRVMAVSDPVSGQTMLIGTTRQVSGDHAMVDVGRSAPGYVLLPSWLGLALETSSDLIDLKVGMSSYTLSIADKASTIATAAPRQENQFSIPTAPPEALFRQLSAQVASAAAAPPRGRGQDRIAAARTMLALGMSAEAGALLNLAATDDPVVARDPTVGALTGIAAVLAGRPGDATGLDNPALPADGDIALWRGLRDVADGKPASALANAWPLLSAYPEAIRRQITPAVMEAAAADGVDVPASEMEGPSLALARALKLAHDGQVDEAIAALTAVKDSRNERDSVRAAAALAELRLSTGRGSPAETADLLERQTVRWRGGARELSLRLRVAELRSQAGQWRAALDGLRDTQALFPEKKSVIAAAKTGVFRSLLSAAPAAIAPLEMVLIAGEYADGLPDGEDGDRLAGLLADKLAALDLPTRAVPVLKNLMDRTHSPVATAEYGLRLSQMEIDAGDAASAEALLGSLDLSGMPALKEQQRTMLLSRAKAARGDFVGAATTLLTLTSPEADAMRADFYARAGDWQRSLETLDGVIAASVPETGDLNDKQQDLILRDATAAVQAGNAEALKRLSRFERRMMPPRAELFRVLTASAIRGPEDLPRASRELAMSKALPDRLNALKVR